MASISDSITATVPSSFDVYNEKNIDEIDRRVQNFMKSHELYKGPVYCSFDEVFHHTIPGKGVVEVLGLDPDTKPVWEIFARSRRTEVKVHKNDPSHVYKFSVAAPGAGNIQARFLRVPFGERLRQYVKEHEFDRLKIVKERLICEMSQEEMESLQEYQQIEHFVVQSELEEVLSEEETIAYIENLSQKEQLEIAHQLMQLICLSGLGDATFDNVRFDKKSRNFVILDTEPIYGAMMLQIPGLKEEDLEKVALFFLHRDDKRIQNLDLQYRTTINRLVDTDFSMKKFIRNALSDFEETLPKQLSVFHEVVRVYSQILEKV